MYISIPDCFVISFFVGLIFGVVYEILRIIRLTFPFRLVICLCDIAFFILSANAIMLISEAVGNYIRIYTVAGFAGGVFSYIVTIGRILNTIENAAARVWQKTIRNIAYRITQIFKKAFGKISHTIRQAVSKNAEYLSNKAKKYNQGLKSDEEILYNKKRLDKIGGRKNVIKANVRKNT